MCTALQMPREAHMLANGIIGIELIDWVASRRNTHLPVQHTKTKHRLFFPVVSLQHTDRVPSSPERRSAA